MAKKFTFGNLIKTTGKDNQTRLSLALGSKNNRDPKYDFSVEITVKDSAGRVIAKQNDGFIDLVDPRTEGDRLLSLGIISEEVAEKMKTSAAKISEKVRYHARIPHSS